MWQEYKRGDLYRVGWDTGRLKGMQWYVVFAHTEPTIYDTCVKAEAFTVAKRLNAPKTPSYWELVEE